PLPSHRRERAVDLAGLSHRNGLKLEPQRAGRVLPHLQPPCRSREEGDAGDLGGDLLEYPQLPLGEIAGHDRQPCDVPPGLYEVGDDSGRDGINNDGRDDRDRRCRLSRGVDRWITGGDDDVHSQADKLGRETGQPVQLSLRPSGLDGELLALHATQLAQTLSEGLKQGAVRDGRAGRQVADTNRPRGLPGGRQRCIEQRNSDEGNERRDHPHHNLQSAEHHAACAERELFRGLNVPRQATCLPNYNSATGYADLHTTANTASGRSISQWTRSPLYARRTLH